MRNLFLAGNFSFPLVAIRIISLMKWFGLPIKERDWPATEGIKVGLTQWTLPVSEQQAFWGKPDEE
jgi:hypothetical protein